MLGNVQSSKDDRHQLETKHRYDTPLKDELIEARPLWNETTMTHVE
jgi:hypothetical protein